MAEYNITDYSIFSDAVNDTNSFTDSINDFTKSIEECLNTLKNDSTFMGPAKDECISLLNKLNTDISSIISNINSIKSLIVTTDSNYQNADSDASNTITNTSDNSSSINNGNMKNYSYDGKNFNVVNTRISIDNYESYLQKNKMYQKGGLLGGQCMLLSQYYAKDLISGDYTSRSDIENTKGAPATRINSRTVEDTSDPVIKYTYDELSKGNPVVLQVSRQKPGRHLVTAVGYSSDVTSYKDLKPENILVLDCYDGKIQTLDKRDRVIYKQNGKYLAYGPTDKFLESVNK